MFVILSLNLTIQSLSCNSEFVSQFRVCIEFWSLYLAILSLYLNSEFMSCNSEFISCNSEFISCNSEFRSCNSEFISCISEFMSCISEFMSCILKFISCNSEFISQFWVYVLQFWVYILQFWVQVLQFWVYVLHFEVYVSILISQSLYLSLSLVTEFISHNSDFVLIRIAIKKSKLWDIISELQEKSSELWKVPITFFIFYPVAETSFNRLAHCSPSQTFPQTRSTVSRFNVFRKELSWQWPPFIQPPGQRNQQIQSCEQFILLSSLQWNQRPFGLNLQISQHHWPIKNNWAIIETNKKWIKGYSLYGSSSQRKWIDN